MFRKLLIYKEKKDKDSIREKIRELNIPDELKTQAIEYFCNFESLEALLSWDPYEHIEIPIYGIIHFTIKEHLERWKRLLHPTTTQYLKIVEANVHFVRWVEPFEDYQLEESNKQLIEELWTKLLEFTRLVAVDEEGNESLVLDDNGTYRLVEDLQAVHADEVLTHEYLPYLNTTHDEAQELVMYLVSELFNELGLGASDLKLLKDNNNHRVGGVKYPDISVVADHCPYIDVEVKPEFNTKRAREALDAGLPLNLPTNSPIPNSKPKRSYGNAKEGLKQLFSRSADFMRNMDHPVSNYGIISDGHSWIFFNIDCRNLTCHYSKLYDFSWDSEMPECFMILAKMMLKVFEMAVGALSVPLFTEFPYKRINTAIRVDTEDGERTMVLLHEVYVGSNSEVYIAKEEKSKRISALKIYHCNDQYENESRMLPLLAGCTGVPQVEFVGRFRDSPVISIFPIGSTLQDIMTKKKLSSDEVLDVGCCLFRILEGIHNRGVVHGDIKPSNLLVTPDNRLILIDYGTAYLAEEGRKTKLMVTDLFSPRMVSAVGVYPGMNGDLESAYFTINFLLDRTLSWADGGRKPSLEDIASSKPELKVLSRYVLDRMGKSFNKLNPVDIYSYMTEV